jgi:hypothetical protein
MKIIRHAHTGSPWAVGKHFKCIGCSKVLQVEATDVILTYKEHGKQPVNFIPCPACDTAVKIHTGGITDQFGEPLYTARGN